jgi:hypothetical protein
MTAQVIDDVLAATFPASDPPAWTAGIARPAPDVPVRAVERTPAPNDANGVRTDVIDVSRPADSERTLTKALASLVGAVGLALLVPFAILAISAPIALSISGVLQLADRLLAIVR